MRNRGSRSQDDGSVIPTRLEQALLQVVKQVVSKTIENSQRLDKLKEVLTRDLEEGEDIEEMVSDLITV